MLTPGGEEQRIERREPPVDGASVDGPAERSHPMPYMQSISFSTDRKDEVLELMSRWSADSIQTGTARRGTMLEDRAAPGSFVMGVSFESAESAAENSDRPETGAFAEQFAALCTEGPEFREFDIVAVYGD